MTFADVAGWCGTGGPALPALLVAGLAGGAMHCGPMCGGFVLGQVADRLAAVPESRLCESARLRHALLLPYHAGRLTTYAALGTAAAALGTALAGQPWFRALSAGLLLLGALLFAGHAVTRIAPALRGWLPRLDIVPPMLARVIGRVTRRIDRRHWTGGLLLGLVLGFLPCGLLYAALLMAAASGAPWRGGLAMLVFGLGTMPSLFAVGIAGQVAGRIWRKRIAGVAPPVMLANAVLLLLLAWQRLAALA